MGERAVRATGPIVGAAIAAAVLLAAPPLAAADIEATFITASDASFSRPHDLVLSPDGGRLYVADMGNDVIKLLDPNTLETLGEVGRGELDGPHDLAFDAAGRLIVADSGNDRLVVFALDGSPPSPLAGRRDGLGSPEGVAVAGRGSVYVTNASRHNVMLLRAGKVVARVGTRGAAAGAYLRPHDVAVAADGTVYVADPGNDGIQLLTAELEYIGALGGAAYGFDEPKYLAIDARGWLYVADAYNHQVKVFDEARALVATVGSGQRGKGRGRLNQPEGVAVAGDLVWISDTYNDRVVLYLLVNTGAGCSACTARHRALSGERD